jgi:double-strand break repair protein MRE11
MSTHRDLAAEIQSALVDDPYHFAATRNSEHSDYISNNSNKSINNNISSSYSNANNNVNSARPPTANRPNLRVKQEATSSRQAANAPQSLASANARKLAELRQSRVVLPDAPDSDTLRILIATDNHLGYAESDSLRRDDSYNSFEEILQAAVDNKADFLLLGGDLFHENKPSRQCLYKTVSLLRKYCFGERNINFELLSNPKINFPTSGGVNYDSENVNIRLPIFAIHGNHDDPAGVGGYSTMDLLHQAQLLNYFGKSERVDKIINHPLIMKKGETKLALYGLGNIRDERLHRTFAQNEVRFMREEGSDCFSVLVLHQNRIRHSLVEKNFISEKMLPNWLDIVIWGHEHERLDEEENEEMNFTVLQPGSSVATSLSQGESVEKHITLLEIQRENFRMLHLPLYTTRPFTVQDVKLSDELDPAENNVAEQIEEFLAEKVNILIEKLQKEPKFQNVDRPALPLIRIRVEHSGFQRVNPARFGQQFVGKLANPEEILSFHKQRATISHNQGKEGGKKEFNREVDLLEHNSVDETPPIHDLVAHLIDQSANKLSILSEKKLAEAVQEFVDKKDSQSIANFVAEQLQAMQLSLKGEKSLLDKSGVEKDDIENMVRTKYDSQRTKERAEYNSRAERLNLKLELKDDAFKINLDDIGMGELANSELSEEFSEEKQAISRGRGRGRGGSVARKRGSRGGNKSQKKRGNDDSSEDSASDYSREMDQAESSEEEKKISKTNKRKNKAVASEEEIISNNSAKPAAVNKRAKGANANNSAAAVKREAKAMQQAIQARARRPVLEMAAASFTAPNSSNISNNNARASNQQNSSFLEVDLTQDDEPAVQRNNRVAADSSNWGAPKRAPART